MTAIGEQAPEFTLPDTDGEEQSLETPAVVVFTCNHCPYALAWHDRIAQAAVDYCGKVAFYAINPNDTERYPRDSPEAMRERVQADGGWPMPYLHDESQVWPARTERRRPRTCSSWTRAERSAIAARPMPTTRTRASTRAGCARRSTRCWPARTWRGPRPTRWAAASSGSDRPDRRLGVAQVVKQHVGL